MRNRLVFFLALIILIMLLIYPIVYTVRFNESAVVTTFGKADPSSVRNADPARPESGLYWKWPWPIQDVHTFDTRVQVLEDRIEELQTLDRMSIIVNVYCTWRIVDPLAFYSAVRDAAQAESQIRTSLRDARSVLGNFTMEDLTSTDPDRLKLVQAEQAILAKLRENLQRRGGQGSLGIAIETVGIKRLILPEAVTKAVFERMTATRQRLAERARSEGTAAATDIEARARSAAATIRSFAERRAQSLRAEGDQAAQDYYKVFQQDEAFAAFLRRMTAYREILKNNSTFLIDAREGLFGEFLRSPGAAVPPLAPGAQPLSPGISVPASPSAPATRTAP